MNALAVTRARRWPASSIIACGLLLLLPACGSGGTRAGSPTSATKPAGATAKPLAAAALTLTTAELPGWVQYSKIAPPPSTNPDHPPATVDVDQSECGVTNPVDTGDPTDRVLVGFAKGLGGPFVYESIGVFRTADAAASAVDGARAAFARCAASGPKQNPPTHITSLALPAVGDQGAGYSMTVEAPPYKADPGMSTPGGMSPDRGVDAGAFYYLCTYTHRALADPIVSPGAVSAHMHDFFGNTSTAASSTTASLLAHPSTCDDTGDRSGYWVPSLIRDGSRVTPQRLHAWYVTPAGANVADVHPIPAGLEMLAGDANSTRPQSTAVVGWSCGEDLSLQLQSTPPQDCTSGNPLTLQLNFPDCWDGQHLTSSDHRSHLAYAQHGVCPADHPVLLAQPRLVVTYPLTGRFGAVQLASGSVLSAHGDLFAAFRPGAFETEVHRCIDTGFNCGSGGGPPGLTGYGHVVLARVGPIVVAVTAAGFDVQDAAPAQMLAQEAVAKVERLR